jgi:hypothetical protein
MALFSIALISDRIQPTPSLSRHFDNASAMNNNDDISDVAVLRANINNETSRISWNELQRFFAGGWLIFVSPDINLLDVAVAFSLDDKEQVTRWLTSGEVAKVTDVQAKDWHTANTAFWSTVVKPWVLIQPTENNGILAENNHDQAIH